MRLIQGRSAQAFNRRHHQLGSLWQERYKAKLVTDPAHFGTVVAYIHLNPVTAGLVRHPSKYGWCGHRELLGRRGHDILDADAALSLFGARRAEAQQAYAATLAARRGSEWLLAEPGRLPWWRPGSSGDEPAPPVPLQGPGLDATGASSGRDRLRMASTEFVDHACTALGAEVTRLASPRRDRETVWARDLICLLAVERYGIRTQDLARLLGRTGDQLSHWTGRGSQRKANDPEFRRALDALDTRLSGTTTGTATPRTNGVTRARRGKK